MKTIVRMLAIAIALAISLGTHGRAQSTENWKRPALRILKRLLGETGDVE